MLGLLVSNFWFNLENGCLDTSANINISILFAGSFTMLVFLLHSTFTKNGKVEYFVYTVLKYLLVYFILVYAIPQIYGIQYSSSYFMQNEKIADLSSRQFMYLFFGHNPGYQKILGWSLFVGSFFLSFRRFNILGIIVLLPIFINIVLLNIFYSACHIVNSSIMVLGLMALSTYHYRRISALINPNLSVSRSRHPLFFTAGNFYKAVVIMKVIFFIGYTSYLNTRSYNFVNSWWNIESPIIQGTWQLEELESSTDTIPEFKTFFFERGRRGIVTTDQDSLSGFQYIIDTSYQQLELWNFHEFRTLDFKGRYEFIDTNTLQFKGTNRKDSLSFVISKIARKEDK